MNQYPVISSINNAFKFTGKLFSINIILSRQHKGKGAIRPLFSIGMSGRNSHELFNTGHFKIYSFIQSDDSDIMPMLLEPDLIIVYRRLLS